MTAIGAVSKTEWIFDMNVLRYSWLFVLLLSGCASFSLESPRVSLASIKSLGGDLFEQRFLVVLNVQNPNNQALPINGIDLVLEVEGKEVATGVGASSVVIEPLSEEKVSLYLTTNMFKGAGVLLKFINEQDKALSYEVTGYLHTSLGLSVKVPFENSGELTLDDMKPKKI
ncbi:LEA type 2 family protein [Corallincola platygyrae]|uniref:LEA type 2 family protein n=1 Tax=Corallincola platygyrae TaxID=1193278 RepID=A0ABW4XMP2_9GAMM